VLSADAVDLTFNATFDAVGDLIQKPAAGFKNYLIKQSHRVPSFLLSGAPISPQNKQSCAPVQRYPRAARSSGPQWRKHRNGASSDPAWLL
jgi:hypothetical protein